MADQEQKAINYIAEAEKKLKSSKGLFSSMFGAGGSKQEEACELYIRAANAFKMAKKWPQAGKAFEDAAELQLAMGSKHDAATNYIDAGNCYRKADPNAAVSAIHRAIEIYTDMGRFSIAAKHHITLAEIYETELSDIEKAVQNYEQAADYYKGEESNSTLRTLENYDKAIEIYEQVATSCMDNSLLKYSARDHFFRASICHMCMDIINAQVAIKKYEEMFPAFADSRECKLVKKLLQAVEDDNKEQFTESLKEFDSISRLEPFLTTLFLRVKKQLNAEPELC
ncbi:unnamed protein product [Candidula unifasciata]|uniref:Alpha-soluble NSF attachment protein n=1 Tax=Candidula unifasciata TaxID=100452 RepID=A0A8S3ZBF1_9EUPU|nr:unnamed protein product [Candidula unifasciata]